ncbi:hypothetical protein, partial [Chryseobacterium sp. CH1]|uniref:hypothetical protein n=1 Tax=Chryseobacterium sp. CH1 TaxID=713551 RepID=UPI0010255D96
FRYGSWDFYRPTVDFQRVLDSQGKVAVRFNGAYAGGVINVVTKRPQFIDQTNVGFRYGSWDFYRPTVDFQRVLDSQGKVAVRFNGAY